MMKSTLDEITNEELVIAVEEHIRKHKHKEHINLLIKKELNTYETYLLGGAVRDALINYYHHKNLGDYILTSDFDLLVDDSTRKFPLKTLCKNLNGIVLNQFGSPKWKPATDLEIDIMPFTNAMMIRNNEVQEASLETVLKSCELNTGAIAYSFSRRTIYSYGAIEAILKKEIDIGYIKGISLAMLMTRIILQSEKLGFTIGEKARSLIAEKYAPFLDERIKSYLKYKQKTREFLQVVNKLRVIQKEERLRIKNNDDYK